MRSTVALGFALALCSSVTAARSHAQDTPAPVVQADRPLATFTPAELAVLEPLLASGVVSLVEFAYGEELPAVVIACIVEASADEVARVIGDPAAYPTFMPALDSVAVTTTEGDAQSYDWTWQTSIFTLRGQNTMQRYAPPPDHPERGYRFVMRQVAGDLGTGRTVWRVVPRGEGRSLIMSSSRMDLRDSNYIARQLAAASSTVNRAINVALAFSMVLRTRGEAERRVSFTRARVLDAGDDPEEPAIATEPMEAMLLRGDLMWVETSDGTDQGRVVAIGRMHTDEARTRTAILDPAGFTQGFLQGAHATSLEAETGSRFEWGIDLPLVGTRGVMHMTERPDTVIALDGESGALEGARWRFRTTPRDYGTLVTAWGRFDLAEGLWLVRVVQDADAAFRPGLSASAELMMLRGLRARVSQ
jgi:hypothetical protein